MKTISNSSNFEIDRIKSVYSKRQRVISKSTYSLFNPAHWFEIYELEKNILSILRNNSITDLSNYKILDIGCGGGQTLQSFIRFGAKPKNLYGVDLMAQRINIAKTVNTQIHFQTLDASKIPFKQNNFDIVILFTVFSSILDANLKQVIANEAKRVVKDKGLILWYDLLYNNPNNPDIIRVKFKEIKKYFSGCDIRLSRITLAPPITRRIIKFGLLVYLLNKIKIFNTHYFGTIIKK